MIQKWLGFGNLLIPGYNLTASFYRALHRPCWIRIFSQTWHTGNDSMVEDVIVDAA